MAGGAAPAQSESCRQTKVTWRLAASVCSCPHPGVMCRPGLTGCLGLWEVLAAMQAQSLHAGLHVVATASADLSCCCQHCAFCKSPCCSRMRQLHHRLHPDTG